MDLRWNEDANTHLIAFCSTRQAPKVNKAASAKNIIFEKIELDFTWELNLLRSYRISKTEDHSKHMCTFQTTSIKQKKIQWWIHHFLLLNLNGISNDLQYSSPKCFSLVNCATVRIFDIASTAIYSKHDSITSNLLSRISHLSCIF